MLTGHVKRNKKRDSSHPRKIKKRDSSLKEFIHLSSKISTYLHILDQIA